jgi:hypothetical protein
VELVRRQDKWISKIRNANKSKSTKNRAKLLLHVETDAHTIFETDVDATEEQPNDSFISVQQTELNFIELFADDDGMNSG